jgi:hypothetical protein
VSTRLLVERLQTYLSPAERAALGDDSAAEAA